MADWNSLAGLWQKALADKIQEELETCLDGINDSGLPYTMDGGVRNHFGYNFINRGIAYKIVQIEREMSSDYDVNDDTHFWRINATISIRVYFSDIASDTSEQEYQTAIVNMLSNYLNEIKTLETETINNDGTSNACATWHNFATGREVADVAWFDGGFGSQIDLTCQTQFKQ